VEELFGFLVELFGSFVIELLLRLVWFLMWLIACGVENLIYFYVDLWLWLSLKIRGAGRRLACYASKTRPKRLSSHAESASDDISGTAHPGSPRPGAKPSLWSGRRRRKASRRR
jgi:hypothetical protein